MLRFVDRRIMQIIYIDANNNILNWTSNILKIWHFKKFTNKVLFEILFDSRSFCVTNVSHVSIL